MKNLILIIAVLSSINVNSQEVFKELKSYPTYESYDHHPFFGSPYMSEDENGVLFVYSQTLSVEDIEVFFDEVDRVLAPHGLYFDLTEAQALDMAVKDTNNNTNYEEVYRISDDRDDFFCLEIKDGIMKFKVGFEK